MDPVIAPPAPAQPAPIAQPSAETKPTGNQSAAQVRQFLVSQDKARQTQAAAEPIAPVIPFEASPEPAASTSAPSNTAPTETAPTPADPAQAEPPEAPEPDVLSNLKSLDPKTKELVEKAWEERKQRTQEKIDKRIGKITAEKKAYEQELTALRQQVQQQQQQPQVQPQQPPPPVDTTPFSDINDPAALNRLVHEAKQTIRECDALLYRDDISQGVQLGDRTFTKQQILTAKLNAQTTLDEHVPVRAQFLQQKAQAVQTAMQKYPFLRDQNTPEFREVVRLAQLPAFSGLRNSPYALEILSSYVVGQKSVAAPVVPAPAPRTAPRPPGDQTATSSGGFASPRSAPEARTAQAMKEQREKLGLKGNVTSADARAYLKNLDQSRNS